MTSMWLRLSHDMALGARVLTDPGGSCMADVTSIAFYWL